MKSNQTLTGTKTLVVIALALWLAVVWIFAACGAFAGSPGSPPLPLLLGVVAPLLVFFIAYRFSRTFHEFVLTYDLRLATAMQAWRFAGLEFLALYVQGVLPASFALPAGLGDLAIGVTAPWILLALIRRPNFATGRLFVIWNWLGILDLIVAVSSGGLNAMLARGIPGEVTTQPMTQMPLILIPAYFVPIFLMLHFSALLQVRRPGAFNSDDLTEVSPAALPANAR